MNYLRMYEQVDRTGDNLTYSWIFDAPYRRWKKVMDKLPAWKWVRGAGCPGSFVTTEKKAALEMSSTNFVDIRSNGSHDSHKAPYLLVVPRKS